MFFRVKFNEFPNAFAAAKRIGLGRSARIPSTIVVNMRSVVSGEVSGEVDIGSVNERRSQVNPRHSKLDILIPSSMDALVTFSIKIFKHSGHS